jgi:hypothetical protein
MARVYTIYTKDIGSSPDVWAISKTVESDQVMMQEVLRLVDNVDPKVSIAVVRNT